MKSRKGGKGVIPTRDWQRFPHLRDLSISYEGQTETISIRSPDISRKGMFINTPNHFPEGAVLKLSFMLTPTGLEVQTRCEVWLLAAATPLQEGKRKGAPNTRFARRPRNCVACGMVLNGDKERVAARGI